MTCLILETHFSGKLWQDVVFIISHEAYTYLLLLLLTREQLSLREDRRA